MAEVDFFLVGPQRTGTSWCDSMLRRHPSLALPQNVKETTFFDKYYDRGIEWYEKHYDRAADSQLKGEVCTTYFDTIEARDRIKVHYPNAKIIIILRDPVSRTLSLHNHHLTKGRVVKDVHQAVKDMPRLLDSGRYSEFAKGWIEKFSEERVLFVNFDDIGAKPAEVLQKIFKFLDVDKIDIPQEVAQEKVGQGTTPKYPLLAKMIAQGASFLRKNNLHKVAQFGKSIGLTKVFGKGKKSNDDLEKEAEKKFIYNHLKEEISFAEEKLQQDLSHWHIK